MKKLCTALLCSLLAAACSHPLKIVGEGDILSATGNRDCLLEDYLAGEPNCAKNKILNDYDETYYGVARPGWYFHRWGSYCKNAPSNECSFNLPGSFVNQYMGATVPPLWAIFRPDVITGYNALFMGHSLFHPMATGMPDQASEAGFNDHAQQTFFYAGGMGSPEYIWNDPVASAQVKAVLDQGNTALFGMAYHPDYPGMDGYRNWVNYALQKNPDTRFFIGLPWQWYADQTTAAAYETSWHAYHPAVTHAIIDTLRQEFPKVDFFCIPYGQAAVELYKLYDAGNLPDVDTLVSLTEPAVFLDSRGHPDAILQAAAELVWLNAIYNVDMDTYGFDPGYITDLKAIAKAIADGHDPNYNAPEWQ